MLPAILLVAGCGSGSDTGPGGVSEGEAAALDEAAETLDKQQIPEGAIPPLNLPPPSQTADEANASEVAATEQSE